MAKSIERFLRIARKHPIYALAIGFLMVSFPVNHFLLGDYPNNPLEQMELFVIRAIIGIDFEEESDDDKSNDDKKIN